MLVCNACTVGAVTAFSCELYGSIRHPLGALLIRDYLFSIEMYVFVLAPAVIFLGVSYICGWVATSGMSGRVACLPIFGRGSIVLVVLTGC